MSGTIGEWKLEVNDLFEHEPTGIRMRFKKRTIGEAEHYVVHEWMTESDQKAVRLDNGNFYVLTESQPVLFKRVW